MPDNIVIRLATIDDLGFVTRDGHVASKVVSRKIEHQEVLIAERDGAPVGYLRLEYLWSAVPYIALITVVPEHRRCGVGRTMLRFLDDDLRRNGHTHLYSSSQTDEAEPQAWHRHMGFEECGFIAGLKEGGIGEVFFRKSLL